MESDRQDDFQILSVCQVLVRLGVTANYRGFQQCAYAVCLCVREPERLSMITKSLYPDVAKRYHTTAGAVERNIRYVVARAWKQNPTFLRELAGAPIVTIPTASQFFAILAFHFLIGPSAA